MNEQEPKTDDIPKKEPLFFAGCVLVVVSYILWLPVLLFTSMSFGDHAWICRRLAVGSYAASWILFIMGFLLAGPGAVRAGRCWIVKLFKMKS